MLSSFKPVIYIQISPECITVKNVKSGEMIAEVPEMAISTSSKPTILAVGTQARVAAARQPARVVNPFSHPRSLVSDFMIAEEMLKYYLHRVLRKSFLALAPIVVMHPLSSPAGGFTQVERRVFREMAAGAGASEVVLWVGSILTDQQLLSRAFPTGVGEKE